MGTKLSAVLATLYDLSDLFAGKKENTSITTSSELLIEKSVAMTSSRIFCQNNCATKESPDLDPAFLTLQFDEIVSRHFVARHLSFESHMITFQLHNPFAVLWLISRSSFFQPCSPYLTNECTPEKAAEAAL
jgi:hypothetical protein